MHMQRNSFLFLIVVLLFAVTAAPSFSQPTGLIIQLEKGQSPNGLFPQEKSKSAALRLLSSALNIHYLPAGSAEEARRLHDYLEKNPAVQYVSYDQNIEFRLDPNDDRYDRQWSLPRIEAPAVWGLAQGGRTANGDEIVIAVIDSGFDIQHPDLAPNIWNNNGEIAGDNLDNDQNGLVDDLHGWDFVDETADLQVDWHGHSVAGIAGARGNNGIGVAGVSWEVKLMLFSVRRVSDVIGAFDYILDQRRKYNESRGQSGAFVVTVNTSLGLNNSFCDSQPSWRDIYDQLGAQGVLSVASPPNSNIDVDVEGDIPTTCPSDFLLTVLRTNEEDQKDPRSGYGTTSIDLGVPGNNIYTTDLNDGYHPFSGTSASSPHLSGAIALLYSLPCPTLADQALANPAVTALLIKSAVLNGVDLFDELEAYSVTGGRLNVKNSADILLENCEITEESVQLVNLWPNPADDFIRISYQLQATETGRLLIYNALGQEVWRDNVIPTGAILGEENFPVANLSPGIYFLVLKTGDQRAVRRFVVY
jgi:subtilisin family serine protease